jgi:hypothetical protein
MRRNQNTNHEPRITTCAGRWLLLLSAAALLLNSLFLIQPAAASNHVATAGPLSIITSPLPISLSTDPGKPVTADLRVKNNGSTTERLKIDLMKFSAFGEDGKPRLEDPEPTDDYFKWVSFPSPVFTAEPGVWKTVRMTINPPKTAALGYYYAAVFSRADSDRPEERQTALKGGTATLVLLDVRSPNAKRALDVLEFSSSRRVYEFLPASFTVKLRNPGNIHLRPIGTIFITRGKREVDQITVNSELGNILPGSNRIFESKWHNGFPVYTEKTADNKVVLDDKGKQVHELKWDFTQVPKLRFGRYHAHLAMAYDDGKRDVPLEADVSFWVIPWRLVIYAIAIPVIPALLVYFIMRRNLKKARRRS